MRDIITQAQARAVADQLVNLAEQLSDFYFKNFASLSTADSSNLRLKISSIRRQASDMTAAIVGQTIADLQGNLEGIAKATNEAEKALTHIQEIRKALDVATATIRLAAAVITLHPVAILDAASNLISVSQ